MNAVDRVDRAGVDIAACLHGDACARDQLGLAAEEVLGQQVVGLDAAVGEQVDRIAGDVVGGDRRPGVGRDVVIGENVERRDRARGDQCDIVTGVDAADHDVGAAGQPDVIIRKEIAKRHIAAAEGVNQIARVDRCPGQRGTRRSFEVAGDNRPNIDRPTGGDRCQRQDRRAIERQEGAAQRRHRIVGEIDIIVGVDGARRHVAADQCHQARARIEVAGQEVGRGAEADPPERGDIADGDLSAGREARGIFGAGGRTRIGDSGGDIAELDRAVRFAEH